MNQRTTILCDLIEAAKRLDELQDALTRAYVSLQDRKGEGAQVAFDAVWAARDASFEPGLGDLIEQAITTAARMP